MTHSNVDPDEIAKFEALASRWWDENSEFKPLHDINPLRAGWIDQFSDVRGKRLIDVGCGGGLLSEAMAHRGATVTGIDMGEASNGDLGETGRGGGHRENLPWQSRPCALVSSGRQPYHKR